MAGGPMYRQIADDLRAKIESGELAQGSRLPTEIELMEQYDASRNTVRDAIKVLTTRTLVETRPGQGTFVVEEISPFVTTLTGAPQASVNDEEIYIAEVEAASRQPAFSDPQVEIQQPSQAVANSLRLKPDEQVLSRHRKRYIDGIPWSLETSFYPMSLVTAGATRLLEARNIGEGTVTYLARELGIKQIGYRDSIAVRPPDENEIAFFRLPGEGQVPVFVIFRVAFSENSERIRLTVTVYPADRNRFLVNVGTVPQWGQDTDSGR